MNGDGLANDARAGDVAGRGLLLDEVLHGVHLEAINVVPVVDHFVAVAEVTKGDDVKLRAVGEDEAAVDEVVLDGVLELHEVGVVGDEGAHPLADNDVVLLHGELGLAVAHARLDEGDVGEVVLGGKNLGDVKDGRVVHARDGLGAGAGADHGQERNAEAADEEDVLADGGVLEGRTVGGDALAIADGAEVAADAGGVVVVQGFRGVLALVGGGEKRFVGDDAVEVVGGSGGGCSGSGSGGVFVSVVILAVLGSHFFFFFNVECFCFKKLICYDYFFTKNRKTLGNVKFDFRFFFCFFREGR